MIIRKATAEDIEKVSKIYADIHSEEAAGKITTGWLKDIYPVYDTAKAAFERDDLFVAEANGKVVAAAIINKNQGPIYEQATWQYEANDENVMVLHTLVVSPECAKNGIGTEMVSFYEKYAFENNCLELRMDTNARNLIARKLYNKLGYKEVSIVPCVFNGIPDVHLVCLEKRIG